MAITKLTEENVETMMAEPLAWLYKHSPTCPVSGAAKDEVDAFVESHGDVPIYMVDVIVQRPLSQELERRLAIRHESPQAILLKKGEPVWNDSHNRVTVEKLEGAMA